MARRCSVCSRPDAGSINALLADGRSARSVAMELGLSEDALQRHAANHARRNGRSSTVQPRNSDDPLDELVDALREQALAGNPAIVHQYRLALAAQADARHAVPPRSDLATEPEWIALRTRLMLVLEPYPEAIRAVVAALR
jgi:hypothetical protein